MEIIIVTCMDAVATAQMSSQQGKRCNLSKLEAKIVAFFKGNKKTFPRFLVLADDFIACFPLEIPHGITFYPIHPKEPAEMAGIGNKVYWVVNQILFTWRWGSQIAEVTCGGSPHLSCKSDRIKMKNCMERWVTPAKRVTSPTWGPRTPCKQALIDCSLSSVEFKPRPDQHTGFLNNCVESATFVMTSANLDFLVLLDKDDKPQALSHNCCSYKFCSTLKNPRTVRKAGIGDVEPSVVVCLSWGRDCYVPAVIGVMRCCGDPARFGKPE